jgi:hypothetical protein
MPTSASCSLWRRKQIRIKKESYMSTAYPNTALIINKAKDTIDIYRHPDFDDEILTFDGVKLNGTYHLSPQKEVHVGATTGDVDVRATDLVDIGLILGYKGNERFMDIGNDRPVSQGSPKFHVIEDDQDDGSGPLVYVATDATDISITLTFRDKA